MKGPIRSADLSSLRSGPQTGIRAVTVNWAPEKGWPPQCCVPAFLYAALKSNGVAVKPPAALPARLGVRVSPGDANPFKLPVAIPPEPSGVTVAEITKRITAILQQLNPDLGFRHLRLKEIPFELYEVFLEKALRIGLTVGVGVNYANFLSARRSRDPTLHVFRVISVITNTVTLFDDSGECKPGKVIENWVTIERAALSADDGFWLVGPQCDLLLAQ